VIHYKYSPRRDRGRGRNRRDGVGGSGVREGRLAASIASIADDFVEFVAESAVAVEGG
jgi:hypothetical protein